MIILNLSPSQQMAIRPEKKTHRLGVQFVSGLGQDLVHASLVHEGDKPEPPASQKRETGQV